MIAKSYSGVIGSCSILQTSPHHEFKNSATEYMKGAFAAKDITMIE
jgi:hypothetical protein